MNRTLAYLEAHLTDGGSPEEISRLMACPYTVFQRMFGPLTGVSLSEYLRRRRLSLAAEDLRHADVRVIDVAVKYGYDSADAFAAAFRRMHGLSPQEARQPGAKLRFYTRMSFTMILTGVQEMEYRVWDREAFQVMGIRRVTPTGGGTWAVVKGDGSAARMEALSGHRCDLGLCFGFDAQGNNDYLCGVEWPGEAAPGFTTFPFPAARWLCFPVRGSIAQGALGLMWKRIYGEFLPQSGFRPLDLPTVEQYVRWDEPADACEVNILLPVEPDCERPADGE